MTSNYLKLLTRLGKGSFHPGGFAYTQKVLASLALPPGTRVLDAGCGYGETSTYLASKYKCMVTGIDFQHAMIHSAKNLAAKKQVTKETQFLVADITQIPFNHYSFDMVLSESVLFFVPIKATLKEVNRVLRPGGKFIAIETVTSNRMPTSLRKEVQDFYGIKSLHSAREMATYLYSAGFSKVTHSTVRSFVPTSTMDPLSKQIYLTPQEWKLLMDNNQLLLKSSPYLGFTCFEATK
ncbi:class I SAM-dependent methyltransferase [Aneurinibacillus terranovensis]|uniref:class I SAM-dependent methyltransferase n=1 Tax=Aneurinibacillus terranovensis TaxID=278991 RepID=UPI00040B5DBE|nr:class I SAM-dependent methyltransferase [Aneurinibacillus terranovensis]